MDNNIMYRGVYAYFVDDRVMYVGSSACGIAKLEQNHRGWKSKGYSKTKFRAWLTEDGKDGTFKWLIKPAQRTQYDVEALERDCIQALRPPMNIDYDPVASSQKYGRY